MADFIGDINIFEAKVESKTPAEAKPAQVMLDCEGLKVTVEQDCAAGVGSRSLLRSPEKVRISLDAPCDGTMNVAHGEVWDIGYLGDFSIFIVKLDDGRIMRAAQAMSRASSIAPSHSTTKSG